MSQGKKVVFWDDPESDPDKGGNMQFRLTYKGVLLSSGNRDKCDNKHDIRMALHPQLKRLWEVTQFLREGGSPDYGEVAWTDSDYTPPPTLDPRAIAKRGPQFGSWRFVPLVRQELELMCGIDILFLRPGVPGKVVEKEGDLDGRLKTLLDALAIPDSQQGYCDRSHNKGDNPLYVLLNDDRLITKVSVETDNLLSYKEGGGDNQVELVITVTIKPYALTTRNLFFG